MDRLEENKILTKDDGSKRNTPSDDIKENCCTDIIGECSGNSVSENDFILYDSSIENSEKMCGENYEVLSPCFEVTDETTCNNMMYEAKCSNIQYTTQEECCANEVWKPEENRCEYLHGHCYPIEDTKYRRQLLSDKERILYQ